MRARYEQLLAAGSLQPDAKQQQVVQQLDQLLHQLSSYRSQVDSYRSHLADYEVSRAVGGRMDCVKVDTAIHSP